MGALSMAVCISGDACAPVGPDAIAKLSTEFGRAGSIVGRDGDAHGTVVAGFSGMGPLPASQTLYHCQTVIER